SERQLRLFACGCVRVLGHLLSEQKARRAFFVAERYADGLAEREELGQAHLDAQAAYHYLAGPKVPPERRDGRVRSHMIIVHDALVMATGLLEAGAVAQRTMRALLETYHGSPEWARRVKQAQCGLLRDLFGNPFRRRAVDARWLQGTGRG